MIPSWVVTPLIRSNWHWQWQCPCKRSSQKSRSQRLNQILPQFGQVWTVTPVWIHIWLPNDAQSLKRPRNVPYCFFSCDQAALWMVFSVCLSVCLSVRLSVTPFWLCSDHRIIMKFSGVITTDQGNVHAKGQGQRSKIKVTEVTTQLSRFRTVTPVWIHIWWWNDIYSLMLLRRGALLFFKVIRQISRSHGSKNLRIWPRLGVSGL